MVQIKDAILRQSKDGREFYALELQGDLEMVQSLETGRFYATARRCSVTSTFDEATAKMLIGKTLPGRIVRSSCESYDYTVPETGEVIQLAHRYEYLPEETPMEQVKVNREVVFA